MDITRESWNRTQDEIAKLRRQIDDQYFSSGDSLQLNQVTISGIVTNSTKTVHLTVVSSKSLKNITSVTVATMTGSIIGDMGYVDNSSSTTDWKAVTGISISAEIKDEHLIDLRFTTPSALDNVSNNRPIAYYPSNSSIGGLVLEFSQGDHVDGGILYLTGSQSVSGNTLSTSGSVSGGILTI